MADPYLIAQWLAIIKTSHPEEAAGLEKVIRDSDSDDRFIEFLQTTASTDAKILQMLELMRPVTDRAVGAYEREVELKGKEVELAARKQATTEKAQDRRYEDIWKPLVGALLGAATAWLGLQVG